MSHRMIPDDLLRAQRRYMQRTGVQISQTEVQRLSAALNGGATVNDAVQTVYDFFAKPIDWEAERASFADWIAKRATGAIVGEIEVGART